MVVVAALWGQHTELLLPACLPACPWMTHLPFTCWCRIAAGILIGVSTKFFLGKVKIPYTALLLVGWTSGAHMGQLDMGQGQGTWRQPGWLGRQQRWCGVTYGLHANIAPVGSAAAIRHNPPKRCAERSCDMHRCMRAGVWAVHRAPAGSSTQDSSLHSNAAAMDESEWPSPQWASTAWLLSSQAL